MSNEKKFGIVKTVIGTLLIAMGTIASFKGGQNLGEGIGYILFEK